MWDRLRHGSVESSAIGPAASLVITLRGALRGPHRFDQLSKQERAQKTSRIDFLCAELAKEIADLRDVDFGLPLAVCEELEKATESSIERWETEVLNRAWTELVLCITDAHELQAGTRNDWSLLVNADNSGVRNLSLENVRKKLISRDNKVSETIAENVMESLKQDTSDWLQKTIEDTLEPVLWALQDGIRKVSSEPQTFHKPRDQDERLAFVVRRVHEFFRQTLDTKAAEPTAIVIRAVQNDLSLDSHLRPMTAARVSGIVSARSKR